MKTFFILVLLLILLTLAPVAQAARPANLIPNGGFEQVGFAGWRADGFGQWAWYDVPGVKAQAQQGQMTAHAGFSFAKRVAHLKSDWVRLAAGRYRVRFCFLAPIGYPAQNLLRAQLRIGDKRLTLYHSIAPVSRQPICIARAFSLGVSQHVRMVFRNAWLGDLDPSTVYLTIQGVNVDAVSLKEQR